MKTLYKDLVEQTHTFPQEEFRVQDGNLKFHEIDLIDLVQRHGSPLKITYLPRISEQIHKTRTWFADAIQKTNYQGQYSFAYCTKSAHFSFILEECLKNEVDLETSSAFDVSIIQELKKQGKLPAKTNIICNGFKPDAYIQGIAELINSGDHKVTPIFDHKREPIELINYLEKPCSVGIRIASEEEPKFQFYTSRLGVRYREVVNLYREVISQFDLYELKMLHFFINTGINDTSYYWNELLKSVRVYCELKKICPTLDTLNIGGGFPIKNSLSFDFDYAYMIEEIILQIKKVCNEEGVEEPNIYTEFGSYTVGESGALIFKVLGQKHQNDRERWNMIDSSFMTTIPDSWALNKKFLLMAVNNWNTEYERVLLGGLTCDSDDYYNSEAHSNAIYLPKFQEGREQYIGFFHTGAYQESVGGYGGINHCLLPDPKWLIIDRDEHGKLVERVFSEEQTADPMLRILGY